MERLSRPSGLRANNEVGDFGVWPTQVQNGLEENPGTPIILSDYVIVRTLNSQLHTESNLFRLVLTRHQFGLHHWECTTP